MVTETKPRLTTTIRPHPDGFLVRGFRDGSTRLSAVVGSRPRAEQLAKLFKQRQGDISTAELKRALSAARRSSPANQVLNLSNVAATRQRQTSRGRKLDDKRPNKNTGPFIVRTKLDEQIQRIWLADPGNADIIGIDTVSDVKIDRPEPRRPRAQRPAPTPIEDSPPPPATAAAFKGKVAYQIIGGDRFARARVDQTIRNNFSAAEIRDMRGLVIEIARGSDAMKGGVAGYYVNDPSAAAVAPIIGRKALALSPDYYIRIGRSHTGNDVITHEVVHHIRAKRLERGQVASQVTQRASAGPFGDKDLEEAATDLESVSRHNPFQDAAGNIRRPGLVGYYGALVRKSGSVGGQLEEIAQLELEDRAIITLGTKRHNDKTIAAAKQAATNRDERLRNSGLQNRKVIDRIEQRFVDTNIANFGGSGAKIKDRIRGRAENIDQYFAIVSADGTAKARVHFRTDKRREDLTDEAREDLGAIRAGQALVEMRDGRAVLLKGSRRAARLFQERRDAAENQQRVSRPALRFNRGSISGRGVAMRSRSAKAKLVKSRRDR